MYLYSFDFVYNSKSYTNFANIFLLYIYYIYYMNIIKYFANIDMYHRYNGQLIDIFYKW